MKKMNLLVGSYNIEPFGSGDGLSLVSLDLESGKLEKEAAFPGCRNPSYLAKNGERIYAVQELLEKGSTVSYRLTENKELQKIGNMDAPGGLMCHLTIWPGGKFISASNYWTGSLTVFPVMKDGALGSPTNMIQYSGQGVNKARQEGPHTHSSTVDPSGRWLVVAELGIDKIFLYRISEEDGTLIPAEKPATAAPAGSGPRHCSFSKDGTYLYVTAELESCVLCYFFDADNGVLQLLQKVSALPASFSGDNLTADIHLSKDGRYLYVSNRGHDSIAVFAVGGDGLLQSCEWFSCGGEGPRHFRLIDEDLLLIANQVSGNLVCIRRNPTTGALKDICSEVSIPSVVFTLPI